MFCGEADTEASSREVEHGNVFVLPVLPDLDDSVNWTWAGIR